MTQNDFFVAIQGVMLQAKDEGWKPEQIVDYASEAVAEFEEEYVPWDEEDG